MDTGKGYFEEFYAKNEEEAKEHMERLLKLYPGHGGIFHEGEEIELKGSRFRISKIITNGLKLELLPKE